MLATTGSLSPKIVVAHENEPRVVRQPHTSPTQTSGSPLPPLPPPAEKVLALVVEVESSCRSTDRTVMMTRPKPLLLMIEGHLFAHVRK